MVLYFLCWTMEKLFESIPDEWWSTNSWAVWQMTHSDLHVHEMSLSNNYCGKLEFLTVTFLRLLERVFVESIVNIRNEGPVLLGSWGMNRSAEQKQPENCFTIHPICLSRTLNHSHETRRHSFFKCTTEVGIQLFEKNNLLMFPIKFQISGLQWGNMGLNLWTSRKTRGYWFSMRG